MPPLERIDGAKPLFLDVYIQDECCLPLQTRLDRPNASNQPHQSSMPLEVQDSGEGVSLKTTAAEGEKIPVDEAAKVSSPVHVYP